MSATGARPGPPPPPLSIVGLALGALDPAQPARLLSFPDSTLSFATFHPLTASHTLQNTQLRGDELCSKKRVVIETLPTGESFWRWVPRAKGVENGGDEGEWPRVVDICGRLVMCSQDQWDIYKLDPAYDCTVYPAPALSTITHRPPKEAHTAFRESPATAKRAYVEESSDEDLPMPGSIKKPRPAPINPHDNDHDDDSADSDEEVEMIVESVPGLAATKNARRKKMEENRKKRREKLAAAKAKKTRKLDEIQDLSMLDLTIADSQPTVDSQQSQSSQASAPPSYSSQLPSYSSQPPSYSSQPSYDPTHSQSLPADHATSNPFTFKRANDTSETDTHAPKRARRTQSPSTARQEFAKKLSDRGRFRQGRYHERLNKMREERDRIFVEGLRAGFPPEWRSSSSSTAGTSPPTPQDPPLPDDDAVSLEEKIRRIREINTYERARRERDEVQRKAEATEAEKRRKQEEALRREREKAERLRQEREREEERRRRQQHEETERRRREAQEAEARRREQAQRAQEERWARGPWTAQRALERYRTLADAFDAAQFSAASPAAVAAVPWPVLHRPGAFALEDVDWAAVEAFFAAVRAHMRAPDYRAFVEKSHRRFHPDRWRARRVLQSVEDDELRACLEVAANTVAQAITPLWREVKST